MAEDIYPALLERVQKAYRSECKKNPFIDQTRKAVADGRVTSYQQAYKYSKAVGNARAKAFKNAVSSASLPDGRMYFNIADRLIRDTLVPDYKEITEVAGAAQSHINKKAKIGIKTQSPDVSEDKLMGIINRLSSEEVYDDVYWILEDPVRQFCMAAVDDTIRANAEFQSEAGIGVTITRITSGKCCEWCDRLAGVYTYPSVPGEVFARHDNCTCEVDYAGQKMRAYTSKAGKQNTFRV